MNAHTETRTCTYTPVAYQGNETEKKVFKKRKVFREDFKKLTETGSWFQITGAWQEKECWPQDFVRKDGILNTQVSV